MVKQTFAQKQRSAQKRPNLVCYTVVGCMLVFMLVWCYMLFAVLFDDQKPVAVAKPPNAFPHSAPSEDGGSDGSKAALVADPGNADSTSVNVWAQVYELPGCKGKMIKQDWKKFYPYCSNCLDTCLLKFDDGTRAHTKIESVQLFSAGAWPQNWNVSLGSNCYGEYEYADAVLMKQGLTADSGCVDAKFAYLQWNGMSEAEASGDLPTYNIVYSCESSTYFGYQVYANLYGFHQSNQPPGTGYTRLLTASEPDDLVDLVNTFTAPRDPYSHRYSPFNKPDVIHKWFESPQAPTEDVIVVIDPDNWLTPDTSLAKTVRMVKRGMAVAQPAFFHGNPRVQEFFDAYICEKNCGFKVATVGVPYFVQRDDMKAIAALWRNYTKKTKSIFDSDRAIANKYKSLQPGWCAEMYGYVFAAAELGIDHIIKGGLQIRDVDSRVPAEKAAKIPMIHMGRAWFPNRTDFRPGQQWWHTEGKDFSSNGAQVWCKCNWTAETVVPWPIPEPWPTPGGTDFQSTITLKYLHNSLAEYPPLHPSKYRREVGRNGAGYSHTFD